MPVSSEGAFGPRTSFQNLNRGASKDAKEALQAAMSGNTSSEPSDVPAPPMPASASTSTLSAIPGAFLKFISGSTSATKLSSPGSGGDDVENPITKGVAFGIEAPRISMSDRKSNSSSSGGGGVLGWVARLSESSSSSSASPTKAGAESGRNSSSGLSTRDRMGPLISQILLRNNNNHNGNNGSSGSNALKNRKLSEQQQVSDEQL